MSNFKDKLKYINVQSKVLSELETHLNEKNKELADFLIHLAKESQHENEFGEKIKEQGAELETTLLKNIFRHVHRILLGKKKTQNKPMVKEETQGTPLEEKEKLIVKMEDDTVVPALAIPNSKKIDLLKEAEIERRRNREDFRRQEFGQDERRKRIYQGSSTAQDELFINQVYKCKVDSVQDYGFFATIIETYPERQRVHVRKKDGLVHSGEITGGKVNPRKMVKRGQIVFLKIISVISDKINFTMKEVDQRTGEDKFPKMKKSASQVMEEAIASQKAMQQNKESAFNDEREKKRRNKKYMTDYDRFEQSQLSRTGVHRLTDDPNYDDELGVLNYEDPEEEYDIILNTDEAPFLSGQTDRSISYEPVKLLQKPEGSMSRAAEHAQDLARERKELRLQRQEALMEDADDAEYKQGWEDPLADAAKRVLYSDVTNKPTAALNQQIMPEWKKSIMGTTGKITNLSIKEQREGLPVYKLKNQLVQAVIDNNVLIVVGETGSGKTTQITQYLAEAGFCSGGKKIGCTQPRRVAAVSVAKRVAEEFGCDIGQEVGYTIRFDDCSSEATRIKYMTDGMLLREALVDENLSRYSVIMLDEAHERQLHTDVLFCILKQLVLKRKDLKLIVTSATLDSKKFSKYFFECPVFPIPGRTHPVEKLFALQPQEDYLESSLETVMRIHLSEPPGDILVFLTGQEEIDTACEVLYQRMKQLGSDVPELIILPIYSSLPSEMQSRIFEPAKPNSRKVVIATNIAETSITIDGIYYVVDPGYVKQNCYNPKTKVDSLMIVPISKAAANQRSGRAGRTGPGKCYRLYTESAFNDEMLPNPVPEIQRTNMANTVLTLKAMGINDLLNFDFMDKPAPHSLISAMEQLYSLGALDETGLLTKLGRKMAEFPLEPQMSKALIASVDFNCSKELLTIISMLNVQSVFYRPKENQTKADARKASFFQPEGDHLTLLNVYQQWEQHNYSKSWCFENYLQQRNLMRAKDVRKQLQGIMERYRIPIKSAGSNFTKIRKALCSGFFAQAARRDPSEGYKTLVDNQIVYIHPGSSLFHKNPEYLIYHTVVQTSKEYMRFVLAIESKWLSEVAPAFYKRARPDQLTEWKRQEKIEPLHNKYTPNQNEWRLSYREKMFKKWRR